METEKERGRKRGKKRKREMKREKKLGVSSHFEKFYKRLCEIEPDGAQQADYSKRYFLLLNSQAI